MTNFAISFRVGSEGDYSDRYNSMMARIEGNVESILGGTWDETTSFVLLKSSKTVDQLANDIYFNSSMVESWDTLLVIDLDRRLHATHGVIQYPSILAGFFAQPGNNALASLFG